LEKELNCFTVTVPEIKKNRTVTQYGALIDALTGKKISYSSVIVALGDAPLLSLAGFTAATYGGGAPLIIVPVSLASFLDSCFNGTWELHGVQGLKSSQLEYNPSMVWFDTGSFVKLSDNDYVMACSEIIRYAFIGGEEMAQIAIQQWTSLLKKEPAVVADFLRLCFATRVSLGALKMEKATRNAAVRFAQPLAEALKALGMKKPLSSGQALYRAIACMCEAGKRAGTLAPQSAGVYMDLLKMMPSFQLPEPFNCRTVYTTAFKSDPLRTTSPLIALPWCAGSVVVRDDIGETEYIEAFKGLLCPEQG
jgi:3-dehydroquinate synthetase